LGKIHSWIIWPCTRMVGTKMSSTSISCLCLSIVKKEPIIILTMSNSAKMHALNQLEKFPKYRHYFHQIIHYQKSFSCMCCDKFLSSLMHWHNWACLWWIGRTSSYSFGMKPLCSSAQMEIFCRSLIFNYLDFQLGLSDSSKDTSHTCEVLSH